MIDGIEYLNRPDWQMTYGERSALEGLVAALRPTLALEIGTAEGGSLRTIAAHSQEVHSFDIVAPQADATKLSNVTIHPGDSHQTVPAFLRELEELGRRVDLALVDGDHTVDGVQQDAEDVLLARCTRDAVVLFHDTANDDVRAGLDAVEWSTIPDLVYLDLDFVPGYAVTEGVYEGAFWGGLGVAVRCSGAAERRPNQPFLPVPVALRAWRAARVHAATTAPERSPDPDRALAAIGDENARLREAVAALEGSLSWRFTRPLRAARRRFGR